MSDTNMPDEIWVGQDKETGIFAYCHSDRTFCDVKYIRADLCTPSAVDVEELSKTAFKECLHRTVTGSATIKDAFIWLNDNGYLRTPEPTTDEKKIAEIILNEISKPEYDLIISETHYLNAEKAIKKALEEYERIKNEQDI